MNSFAVLLRLTLLNRLSAVRPGSYKRADGKPDVNRIVQTVAVLVLCGLMLGFVILVEVALFRLLSTMRHPELLPAMALLLSTMATLLMGFFTSLGSLYFSRDALWMSYLPVSGRAVLLAKLTELWAGEAVLNALLLLPAFVMYGSFLSAGWLYYVRAVLIVLLSPMLPLAVVALLATLLARVISRLASSAMLNTVLSMAFVLGIVLLELTVIPKMPDDLDLVWIMNLLRKQEGLLQMLTSVFPPVLWAVRGLQGDMGQLLLYALCGVGGIAAVTAVLGGRYLPLCVRNTEQGSTKRRAGAKADSLRVSSPLMAMYSLEVRDILRSSVYLMQCAAGCIIFPLMFGVILLGGSISEDMAVMQQAMKTMSVEVAPTDVVLILGAILAFVMSIAPAASTAVTREGARHAMNRTLPVQPGMMLMAKVLTALTVDAVGLVLTAGILAVSLKLPPMILVGAIFLAVLYALASVTLSMLVDCIRPNLHWTTETQAIKQNLNVMLGMLIDFVLLVLPAGAAILMAVMGQDAWMRFGITGAIMLAESVLGIALLTTVGVKRYAATEP